MPRVTVVYFLEDDGTVPLLEWLAKLPRKAIVKCQVSLTRLEAEGNELRRPTADFLRDGIYELRPSFQGVQYRILYFFHGREAVVISHGLVKEQRVPAAEIDRALTRKLRFQANPARHTFVPGSSKGA